MRSCSAAPGSRPTSIGGTALGWAAGERPGRGDQAPGGARRGPSGRGSFGGIDLGRELTPLHLAAHDDKLEALRTLLELGADPTVRDAIYDSTPRGWAEHFGQHRAAEVLGRAET